MNRKLIFSGSSFERDYGYSRAVVQGPWCFVAGTAGYNCADMTISDDVAQQTEQTLLNFDNALKQAGFSIADVVRVHDLLSNAADFPACQPTLKKWFGDVCPAATMMVAGLINDRLKIEIEVTAFKPGRLRRAFRQQKGGSFRSSRP